MCVPVVGLNQKADISVCVCRFQCPDFHPPQVAQPSARKAACYFSHPLCGEVDVAVHWVDVISKGFYFLSLNFDPGVVHI